MLGARYEDLTTDPEFLFRRLKALGYACNARDDFKRVKAYAKFGGAGSGAHFKPPANHSWSVADWATLVDRLDYENVEGALGYAYDRASPGSWAQHAVTPGAGALGPESGDDAPALELEPPAPDEPSAASPSPPAGGLFQHLRGGFRKHDLQHNYFDTSIRGDLRGECFGGGGGLSSSARALDDRECWSFSRVRAFLLSWASAAAKSRPPTP